MTICDKEGKLLNTATVIANLKPGNKSMVNDAMCVVHDPTGEQLRIAYTNSETEEIRGVSNTGIVSLKFGFLDKSVIILKIGSDEKLKEHTP